MSGELATLEARLHEPLTVRARVKVLNEMAEQLQERDPARGAEVAREAVDLARATGDVTGEAQGLYGLGRNLYSQSDYPAVIESQNAALVLFRALGDAHGEARCCNLIGITHQQLSDHGRALEMYDLALKGFRDAADLKWQAQVLSNIGNVEIQLGNHDAALELFEQALEARRQIGDDQGAGFDLDSVASARIARARALRAQGDPQGAQSEAETAVRLLDRALALAREHGSKRLEAQCVQAIGEAYQAMARPEDALGQLRAALATFEELGSRDGATRALRILSEVHEALGDIAEALACVRKAAAIEQDRRAQAENRARLLAASRGADPGRSEAERHRRLAMEDSLTGLANRRSLDERLGALLREARKTGSVVTLALADVDHFKGINDRFSHAVGDEVLRCVGEILRGHCRPGDLAGRYGGEEFLLVFRDSDMRASNEICERVRRAVEAWDWASIHPQLRVTVSLGLASSSSFDDAPRLLEAAGHWLYEAKHHGRNQVQPLAIAPT